MQTQAILTLLEQVQQGNLDIQGALEQLKKLPFEDLGFAKIDHHREIRNGYPEVIYAQGKTPAQISEITKHLLERGNNILATRASEAAY
ncbi:MAG: 1-(5-phosphoribosyl)-5-amino-4-imidazole-carboxylate carboxylase, partial [Wolinella sp.]